MSSAIQFFTARLEFQTDVSDVHAALEEGTAFTLVDSRGEPGWQQGHIPGALHLPPPPTSRTAPPRSSTPPPPVVTYCWGPGCNGATRAALAFAQLGYQVREMIGGIEYWIREGFPLRTATGDVRQPVDPLTGPLGAIHCAC